MVQISASQHLPVYVCLNTDTNRERDRGRESARTGFGICQSPGAGLIDCQQLAPGSS